MPSALPAVMVRGRCVIVSTPSALMMNSTFREARVGVLELIGPSRGSGVYAACEVPFPLKVKSFSV